MGFKARARNKKKRTPTVGEFMTAAPLTVQADAALQDAHELMRTFKIRHLPVAREGETVGILSMGDLHLLETLKDVNPIQVPVEDAMSPTPYIAKPTTALAKVAKKMRKKKIGAALVAKERKLVGIFTTSDALGALARISKSRS